MQHLSDRQLTTIFNDGIFHITLPDATAQTGRRSFRISIEQVLSGYEKFVNKNIPNGYAGIDEFGQLPSSLFGFLADQLLGYANLSAIQGSGNQQTNKIYYAIDTKISYRWLPAANDYVQIDTGAVLSVNGKPGHVTLTLDDIADSTTRLAFTQAERDKLDQLNGQDVTAFHSDENSEFAALADIGTIADATLFVAEKTSIFNKVKVTFQLIKSTLKAYFDGIYALSAHTHLYEPIRGANQNYLTDIEKINVGHLSGINSGDQVADGETIEGIGTVSDPFRVVNTSAISFPTIKVLNETEFVSAFTTLNTAGGGQILLLDDITLTANRTLNHTNIVILGKKTINFNGFAITVSSGAANYNSLYLNGNSNTTGLVSKIFKFTNILSELPFHIFDKCIFTNVIGSDYTSVGVFDFTKSVGGGQVLFDKCLVGHPANIETKFFSFEHSDGTYDTYLHVHNYAYQRAISITGDICWNFGFIGSNPPSGFTYYSHDDSNNYMQSPARILDSSHLVNINGFRFLAEKTSIGTSDYLVIEDVADYDIKKKVLKSNSGFTISNPSITGATKTKITYDSKGLIISGADATTADINDSTNKRYQTDNQNLYNDATSSIQTQLNNKQSTLTNPITGTGTVNNISKFITTSTQGNSGITDDGTTVNIGTTSAGENVVINATINPTELAPVFSGNSGVNWTFSNVTGYVQPISGSIQKTGDGTGTITPTAATNLEVGNFYFVTSVVNSISGGNLTGTFGGTTLPALTATGITTKIVFISATTKPVFTPSVTGLRIDFTVSWKKIVLGTGNLTVGEKLILNGIITDDLGNILIQTNNGLLGIKGANTTGYDIQINGILYVTSSTSFGNTTIRGFENITNDTTDVPLVGLSFTPSNNASAINPLRNSLQHKYSAYIYDTGPGSNKINALGTRIISTLLPSIMGRFAIENITVNSITDTTEIFSIYQNGNIAAIKGQYLFFGASQTTDTIGDTRQSNQSGVYKFEYCSVASATKGGGTWVSLNTQFLLTNLKINSIDGQSGSYYDATTGERGQCILMTADEAISKGNIISIIQGGTANRVKRTPISGNENDMPIGVALTIAAGAGNPFWMAISGIVQVLPESGLTPTQGYIIYTSASTAGTVGASATAPAMLTHFKECGHYTESAAINTICKAIIHFN